MRTIKSLATAAAIAPAILLCATGMARATSIIGDTVHATYEIYYSSISTNYTYDPTDVVVGSGVELPNYSGVLDVDFGADTVTLTKSSANVGFGGLPDFPFNGMRFTDAIDNIPEFTSFTILSQTGVTGLSSANISFTANQLSINLGDTYWDSLQGATATFQFSTNPVPEPGALAVFGLGLAGLGVMRRRRRRTAA